MKLLIIISRASSASDRVKKAADRYIGGETLAETIGKIRKQQSLKCSIEFMGESTRTEEESNEATNEFLNICGKIKQEQLNATVSLDLSHIGLAVSRDLCFTNLMTICREAHSSGIEVIISAEGTERTDAILQIYQEAVKRYDNVGITVQAYLHRTKDDFAELIKERGRIRVVKGAFKTAEGLSLPRGTQLDEVYLQYVEQLLSRDHKCSIATHHREIQERAKRLVQQHRPSNSNYEFESLFGINNDQLMELKNEGFPVKLYFVYGKEWYLYLCNRIAEYPLNIFRALHDMVG
ncbi:MAG: proline dehydrogenase [Chitinophagaceae bacterium]|nr:MAG: proline dehydrogenase [Chitinophagaceae bacterium]